MNKKKEEDDSLLKSIFDFGSYSLDVASMDKNTDSTFMWTTNTTYTHVPTDDMVTITLPDVLGAFSTLDLDISDLTIPDPFEELEEFRQEKEKEEELRKEHPSLQEAYDDYQLVKKLVEDNEFDKTFEKRYEGFSKK